MEFSAQTESLEKLLDGMPGATCDPFIPPRGVTPLTLMYKVKGKLFAILSVRKEEFVILKSDPFVADVLREQYVGIGHRSHLDRHFWISVALDSDVPAAETAALAEGSYALVRDGLTRRQKAELAELPEPE